MRPHFFYGYVILGLCFANMVVMRGVNGAFGVYYLALLEEFSWSRSDGASIASINYVVYALAAPIVGLAFDRVGPRLLMPLGAALVGLGLMLSSISKSLFDLYFSYGVVTALGQGALGFVGHNALISFWFVKRRATAIQATDHRGPDVHRWWRADDRDRRSRVGRPPVGLRATASAGSPGRRCPPDRR